MKKYIVKALGCVAFGTFTLCQSGVLFAQQKPTDSLHYPLIDRRGDKFTYQNKNSFNIGDTSLLKQNIEYDFKTKRYYIIEKIGKQTYRKPTYLTFQEFYDWQKKKQEADYFKLRADALSALNKKLERPNHIVYPKLFDRTFGLGNVAPGAAGAVDKAKGAVDGVKDKVNDTKDKVGKGLKNPLGSLIDIKPTGNIDILMGYQGQYTNNPTIPERARRTGGFDFDMNANVGVNANIGDKLKLPINYNTLANFDYLNQIKLDYKGSDDEILKSIEAGNIGFEAKGTLIPSATNLFGIKTQLQFGKLFFTAALANQRSQRQSQTLQGGAAVTPFQKKLSDYDENRHFLVAQHFRKNYNEAMSKLPTIVSQINVQRIEVWVTNRNGATTDARDIIAFSDLAEGQKDYLGNPTNPSIASYNGQSAPNNTNNGLYNALASDPSNRVPSKVNSNMGNLGLNPVTDYEKTFARKLTANEYIFNGQLGTLSLNSQLLPDEVLAVAYEYSLNGRVYKVGEFSSEVALDTSARQAGVQKMLFLKLLKATSARTRLPIWRLMMKNVYTLDLVGISREDFKLNVLYDQPSGGMNRYLPESSPAVSGKSIISIIGLDRLNNRNDPQPDGQFDFVEGFTILSQYGRVILPKLEPFGADLKELAFSGLSTDTISQKYVFTQLYDTIKAIAQTYANLDRFVIQGQAKGNNNSEIYLGGFNIPQGSVRINAGGQLLTEGADYTIDYNLGSVKILNQAVLNSGVPVNVSYENNANFGIQQKGFLGLRLDYKASKKFSIGATMERLNERPFFTKMNIGEDPVRNTIYGLDFSYKSNWPQLTKWLDKLPFYSTKTMSTITAYGEAAYFKPGHPPQIGSGANGLIYVDDFEGTKSSLDLRFPSSAWALASTPQGNPDFPEATLTDSLPYNYKRARLAWYNIESNLQDKNSNSNPLKSNLTELSNPKVRQVYTNELFPQQTTNITNTQTQTFDLSYYPQEPGPYNFIADPNVINDKGRFSNPAVKMKNWGGIMRSIDQTDFETNNFEVLEFWVQDPFYKNAAPYDYDAAAKGGKLLINLGSVSEDILKDGKRFYENGLNTPTSPALVDSSNVWGKTPVNPIQVTSAFSNIGGDRPYQDVGFDGLNDEEEKTKRKIYLDSLAADFGTTSQAWINASNDPSHDNYKWFRDGSYDTKKAGILERYRYYNNPQGNSPIADAGSQFSPAATLYPDNEDLNRDNTLNETEQYFEYELNLTPGMNVGTTKYVTDVRTVNVKYADGISRPAERWILFRVPLHEPTRTIGSIPDFKSIRFARMYMTGWEDSTTIRFAKMDLVRNQWRQFTYDVDTAGKYLPVSSHSTFNTLAVNLEENSNRTPVNYVIPPGIERVQQLSNNGVNLLQNEQALSLRVEGLEPKKSRAVFKTLNLDMRHYGKLNMFAHADRPDKSFPVDYGDLNLVVRIGQDYLSNYYEIKYPLRITKTGKYTAAQANIVWPDSNNLDIDLQDLISMKLRRNESPGNNFTTIYHEQSGLKTISIFGNPNLGEVRGIMVAVEHSGKKSYNIDAEVWINELRLSNIKEEGAYAALGRVDIKLADLGSISLSANMHTQGFGSIESRIQERSRENLKQFDAAINIDAGKLLPKAAKLSIPVYASISKTIRSPQYDPYDKDVLYKDKINAASSQAKKDSIKAFSLDQTTIKTINVTNMKFAAPAKPKLWSPSNFDVSLSYTQTLNSSPTVAENKVDKYRGAIGYSFQTTPKYIEPFKKLIKSKSKWLGLVKDINFNPTPSTIGVRADINRQFGRFIPRIVNTDLTGKNKVERVDTTYDKYFTFDRFYNVRWDITRSINLDFVATNNARVDEPAGLLDTKEKRDTVRKNFFDGGRNTLYNQNASASYSLPLSKFPLTDWITSRYSWKSSYNWIGASRVALELGNIIENSQDNTMTLQFDMSKLYNKSRLLRNIENPLPKGMTPTPITDLLKTLPTKADAIKDLTGKKKEDALARWKKQRKDAKASMRTQRQNQQMAIGDVPQAIGKILTMLKTVQVNYSENYKSRIPGWMDSTQAFGQNFKSMQPGLNYVFGGQPTAQWLDKKAKEGLFSVDSNFNLMFRQNFEQKLSFTAQLEPIKELIIDVTLDKSFSKEYTELFKDTSSITLNKSNNKQHVNPYAGGGFSVSFISFSTLFGNHNPNEVSETFKTFEANRLVVSKRLAAENPYWVNDVHTFDNEGYAKGYGKHSQDVLIPAFIAAYTKQDPNKVALIKQSNSNIKNNPFSGVMPKPNWRISYTGLSKIPALATIFSSININHQYSGTLSMNSYTSALQFADPMHYGAPKFRQGGDTGNYIPFFLVPNITIQEQFQPLIGFDITTTNQLNLKFEYKKSRILSLSLVDYQLSETNATEWTVGGSYRKKGVRIPKFLQKLITKKEKLENDLSFKLDVSLRDESTNNSRLDQPNAYGTGGQKIITIQPAIDYVLNNRINIKFFFDQRKVIPYISTSSPTTSTRTGVQVRISLQ